MSAGKRRPWRQVSGVVLLDKPSGITSNAALQTIKRLFQAEKAGHTGSLDPLASGLLPICLGEATKVSGYLLDADKAYDVECLLGITTDSADADGEILRQRPVPELNAAALEAVLEKFRGDILQIPPMHSALKQDGQRLYKLAHRGIVVEREPRPVTVYNLHLVDYQAPLLRLSVRCSKGTYIRSLVEDIGEALGCGAHVTALRRTEVAGTRLTDARTVAQWQALAAQGQEALDAALVAMDSLLPQLPAVYLSEDAARCVTRGQAMPAPNAPASGRVRMYAPGGRFLGIGEMLDDGRVTPKRLLLSS